MDVHVYLLSSFYSELLLCYYSIIIIIIIIVVMVVVYSCLYIGYFLLLTYLYFTVLLISLNVKDLVLDNDY